MCMEEEGMADLHDIGGTAEKTVYVFLIQELPIEQADYRRAREHQQYVSLTTRSRSTVLITR